MTNKIKNIINISTFLVIIISFLSALTFIEDKAIEYPYTEEVEITVGIDTFYLTSVMLSDDEEINTIYSYLAGSYVYTGSYEDVESLIFWLEEYPVADGDMYNVRYYYEEMIEEKLWW